MDRQYEDAGVRAPLADLGDGVDAAAVGQADVHDEHVGSFGGGKGHGVVDRAGLTDHGEVVFGVEDSP